MKIQLKYNPALRRHLAVGDRRRWFFRSIALRIDIRAVPIWTFEIYWRRLLVGAVALAVFGYIGAVTALHVWLKRQPHNQVGWTDVALAPVRWETFRRKRGDTSIEVALERLRSRDYVEAVHGLRVGLARSPGNVRGRIMLSRLYAANDPQQALRILETGLVHSADDPEFLRALFLTYTQLQMRAAARARAEELLASDRVPPLSSPARAVLQAMHAGLLLESDPVRAEQLLANLAPDDDPRESSRIARLRAAALMRLERFDEAEKLLQAAREIAPGNDQWRAEVELALARNDATAFESALRRFKVEAPGAPQVYLLAFNGWHRLKRLTLRDAAEQEFYRTFGADDPAMQLFAASAVNLNLPEVLRRCQTVAERNRLSAFAFKVHRTELSLRNGDLDDAFRHLREWERSIDTLRPQQRAYPELIERLTRAAVASGGNQNSGLLSHLGDMRGRATPSTYRLVIEVLEQSGNVDAAREALALSQRLYPQADNLTELAPRLAPVAPAVEVAKEVPQQTIAPTAAAALTEIDEALAEGSFVSARNQLRAVRTARPVWLAAADGAVSLREVRLGLLTLDLFSARALLRGHLDKFRSEPDALAMVAMAGELLRANRAREAQLVHDELAVARTPTPAVRRELALLNLKDDLAHYAESSEAALAALDRFLAARNPDDALRLHEYLRQKAPLWTGEEKSQFSAREVRMRLALGERSRALTALRELTLRGGTARQVAFELVRSLVAEGQDEWAVTLAREIRKLLPGDKEAETLAALAEAPRPDTTGS